MPKATEPNHAKMGQQRTATEATPMCFAGFGEAKPGLLVGIDAIWPDSGQSGRPQPHFAHVGPSLGAVSRIRGDVGQTRPELGKLGRRAASKMLDQVPKCWVVSTMWGRVWAALGPGWRKCPATSTMLDLSWAVGPALVKVGPNKVVARRGPCSAWDRHMLGQVRAKVCPRPWTPMGVCGRRGYTS